MKIVQKGNKQLRIADERLNEMLLRGFEEIDAKTGKPVKKAPKDEVSALKKEVAALKKENEELKKQLDAKPE